MIHATRPSRLLALGLLALIPSGCAADQWPDVPPWVARDARIVRPVIDTLTAPNVQGRGADNPGITLARDYIHAWFERVGLDPAFGNQFTQPFTIPGQRHRIDQSLSFQGSRNDWALPTVGEQYALQGMSGDGEFEGEGVFVGYGVRSSTRGYDSYGNLPPDALRGKVAIALRYEPMDPAGRSLWTNSHAWSPASSLASKARWAAEHGATALLVVTPPNIPEPKRPRPTRASLSAERAPIPIFLITRRLFGEMRHSKTARRSATPSLRSLQRLADAAPPPPLPLDVTVRGRASIESHPLRVHNVAGILPGAGPLRSKVIVIGAHYDHLGIEHTSAGPILYPGADDNASGVAALLMLAERYVARTSIPKPGSYLSLPRYLANRRTLVFVAFAGEERGLHGSRHFLASADELSIRPGDIRAMINLDMVGRVRDRRIWAFGELTTTPSSELVRSAARGSDLTLVLDDPIPGDSDHTPFEEAGVPTILLFSGMHADYHQPTDTPDQINTVGIVRTVNLVDRLIRGLWASPSDGEPVEPAVAANPVVPHNIPNLFTE